MGELSTRVENLPWLRWSNRGNRRVSADPTSRMCPYRDQSDLGICEHATEMSATEWQTNFVVSFEIFPMVLGLNCFLKVSRGINVKFVSRWTIAITQRDYGGTRRDRGVRILWKDYFQRSSMLDQVLKKSFVITWNFNRTWRTRISFRIQRSNRRGILKWVFHRQREL